MWPPLGPQHLALAYFPERVYSSPACLLSCSRASAQCPAPSLPSPLLCVWSWRARRKHLAYNECWVLLPPWLLGSTLGFERWRGEGHVPGQPRGAHDCGSEGSYPGSRVPDTFQGRSVCFAESCPLSSHTGQELAGGTWQTHTCGPRRWEPIRLNDPPHSRQEEPAKMGVLGMAKELRLATSVGERANDEGDGSSAAKRGSASLSPLTRQHTPQLPVTSRRCRWLRARQAAGGPAKWRPPR